MRRLRLVALAMLAVSLAGCPENVTDPEAGAESPLTGRFEGAFRAAYDTITLDGYLTLELTESESGSLTGGFKLEALMDYGDYEVAIAGAGPLTGSVTPTTIGLLTFIATPDFCPDHEVDFGGTYDRRAGTLLVGGEIDILDSMCEVEVSFPSTIGMRR
jgi:hypothetical protein